jgi:DNA polymerase sigma
MIAANIGSPIPSHHGLPCMPTASRLPLRVQVLQRAAFLNVTPIPHARVPIVKFTDKRSGLPCDLCALESTR